MTRQVFPGHLLPWSLPPQPGPFGSVLHCWVTSLHHLLPRGTRSARGDRSQGPSWLWRPGPTQHCLLPPHSSQARGSLTLASSSPESKPQKNWEREKGVRRRLRGDVRSEDLRACLRAHHPRAQVLTRVTSRPGPALTLSPHQGTSPAARCPGPWGQVWCALGPAEVPSGVRGLAAAYPLP